ncbi:DUF3078 domain-containing protein [Carboxylicivirga marina]|uniref:DUF3078 domain-containing protein n=1 Tax=Carboxylicivirga marina TaxID=2800988 RepID=UPI002597ED69|nr:DUF3078 domain-containing protein [uncultured Carboxylicivirga sp.]
MNQSARSYYKIVFVISMCVTCYSTSLLAQWQGYGFDWRYWSGNPSMHRQWQSSLYKYQNVDKYPELSKLYITDYIVNEIEKDIRIEAYLFPSLVADDVKVFTFEPKFRVPIHPRIYYQPTVFVQKELKDYEGLMQSNSISHEYASVFDKQYFISEARDNYVFSQPGNIQLSWDSIPDAPRIGDGFLERRSARDGINLLLRDNAYNTRPSLEKMRFSTGPWTLKGTENILLAQGYVENWVKGGESSISLGSDLRLMANYKKGKHEWDNYIIHKIGVVSTENDPGRVNNDLIEINTKYGHQASEKWYYSFLYNFKTQFFNGYEKDDVDREEPISGFFAPAYMSFAVGMDFKPDDKFTLLLSPITTRITIVADTVKYKEENYGIPKGKNYNAVNGISVVNNFAYQISREIKLSSRLDAFYQYLGKVKDNEDRQVQIDWEVIMDMRINRFLSTRLLGQVRYFTNESTRVQVRESFNITFSYTF